MFSRSRGDGIEDEAAKSPEDDGVPGIETPDGVDRAATGSLPREGPKALEGPSTDIDRSPEGSAIEPEAPLEQEYPSRSSSRHQSNRSAAAAQRRTRSGALEGRPNSDYDDMPRRGYGDRRGAPEDHRNGYEDRGMRSPAQRVVPRPRPTPQTPKPTVDADKLATPASFGKKAAKPTEPAVVSEDKAPAPPTPKRGWFSWGSKKTPSSKVLETNPAETTTDSNLDTSSAQTPAGKGIGRIANSGPLQNGLAGEPQVGAPTVGRLQAAPLTPSTSGSTPSVTGFTPQSMVSPFAAASKTSSSASKHSSSYDAHTATTPGGVSYTSLYPKKPSMEAPYTPEPEVNGAENGKDAEIAAELAREEAGVTSSCFCLGGGKARRPHSVGVQKA